MYGQKETTNLPRLFTFALHIVFVAIAAWLYFGGGIETVGDWVGASWMPGRSSVA